MARRRSSPARRRRRSRLTRFWDRVLGIVVVGALAWAFIPGLGPDLAQLSPWWERHNLPRVDQLFRPDPAQQLAAAPQQPLIVALRTLPVRPTNPGGYQRAEFGQAWADEDHNGCDTRNDILARDLTHVAFRPGTASCVVAAGQLLDPYTGQSLNFRRGPTTSEAVQIDHVVALGDAWDAGANQWDRAARQRFANDPLNLLAVAGVANQDKGRGHAGQWLPPNQGYRCAYVARQVAVKSRYQLSVTAAELRALTDVAVTCPNEPLPRG